MVLDEVVKVVLDELCKSLDGELRCERLDGEFGCKRWLPQV